MKTQKPIKNSNFGALAASDDTFTSLRCVSLSVSLEGIPGPGDWTFLVIFNGQIVLDEKWHNGLQLDIESLPVDLQTPYYCTMVAEKPLILLLRMSGGKGAKDPDPLMNIDNRAGATVDLFPLVIGEESICIRIPLVMIDNGKPSECFVNVRCYASKPLEIDKSTVPLVMTMISAHCVPMAKEGTVYVGAIGLDQVLDEPAVNFGLSLSFAHAEKTVWATASNAGQAANTGYSIPNEDKFIPDNLSPMNDRDCRSFYWNSINRRRVDPNLLRKRLSSPLVFELAGVPRTGKTDVRGRYMAFVDAGGLLEPGQYGVTVCAKLLYYNENELPQRYSPLLDVPPTSAKISARDAEFPLDEYGHNAHIVIRFDLWDPIVPKLKIAALFETLGVMPLNGPAAPIEELEIDYIPEDTTIDVRKIRKEGGALAVHKELSGLACRGAVPMNQGIKRTAANRLLMQVRSMLKQFPPGNCSYIEWQDTVTAQHAAGRRAVASSFAPQPPQIYLPPRFAAARSRMAGDSKIADIHLERTLRSSVISPRSLLSMALRCLEKFETVGARNYILEGLHAQPRNRFLLWIFGGQEFDKDIESYKMATAALRLAVKSDCSNGTANAIGWGALHTLHHCNNNLYGAFVCARNMRKSYELPREWKTFLQRWVDESGEEEIHWTPASVSALNPLVITAAFFLCLRCFEFVDKLLDCVERGCGTNGSRFGLKSKTYADIYYVRAASLALQHRYDDALKVTKEGMKKFCCDPLMTQMKAICLACIRGWDRECEMALEQSEKAGAEPCSALLLKAALGGMKTSPEAALQRAARAHKIAPCGHSALVIARIYVLMKELGIAERWAAAAVKYEPLLGDGWAVIALIAMYNKHLDKARTMLRTSKQLGTVCPDIKEEVQKMINIIQLEPLPQTLVEGVCFCNYC